jgi:hypothetical protein
MISGQVEPHLSPQGVQRMPNWLFKAIRRAQKEAATMLRLRINVASLQDTESWRAVPFHSCSSAPERAVANTCEIADISNPPLFSAVSSFDALQVCAVHIGEMGMVGIAWLSVKARNVQFYQSMA